MSLVCGWDEGQVCGPAQWVIAFMCDRCDDEGTQDVCDKHYDVFASEGRIRAGCSQCGGTVSWVADRIDGSMSTEGIN
jgi:hypothetical protein